MIETPYKPGENLTPDRLQLKLQAKLIYKPEILSIFAVDAMEVYRINCYGKDPFVSTRDDIFLKYPAKKTTSKGVIFLKEKIPESITNGDEI